MKQGDYRFMVCLITDEMRGMAVTQIKASPRAINFAKSRICNVRGQYCWLSISFYGVLQRRIFLKE